MANGFFLGGVADGVAQRREFDQKTKIENAASVRADSTLQLDQQKQALAEKQDLSTRSNKVMGDLIGTIEESVKAARASGAPQEKIEALVEPLAAQTIRLGKLSGQDPEMIAARIQAIAGRPAEPQSDLAKLNADRMNGYIDEATYQKKMEGLSKGSGTTVMVNTAGEKAFSQELNKGLAGDLLDRRKSAMDAVSSLQSNDEALKLLNSGIITGTGADYLLQFGKALQSAGINLAGDSIANTETFVATRAQEVGRIIKLFGAGTGLSDADREFATRAAAGSISLTEASIRKVLEINARAARNIVKQYNADIATLDPGLVPFDMRLPELPSGGTGETPTRKTLNGVTYEKRGSDWFRIGG